MIVRLEVWLFTILAGILGISAINTAPNQPPAIPASYYGQVTVMGAPLPAGTLIEATIGDRVVARTNSLLVDGCSVYQLDVPADDPSTGIIEGGIDGQSTEFRVAGMPYPQSVRWQTGTNQRVDLERNYRYFLPVIQ